MCELPDEELDEAVEELARQTHEDALEELTDGDSPEES